MRFDRRKLLQWLPPGLAAMFLPTTAKASPDATTDADAQPSESYDVAVVGAGVAGCYAAYRLLNGELEPGSPLAELAAKNASGKLNVGLFEYAGRVGGRLLSAEIPGIGDGERKYSEFGGFRFQQQMHIVADLADHLGLDYEPFPVDEPPENFVHLRGVRFRRCQLSPLTVDIPYNLTPSELALLKAGGDFTTYVANQAFAKSLAAFDNPNYNDPNDPSYPILQPYPTPNGYISLRTQYHAAFQAQDWAKVAKLREAYETAKLATVVDGRNIVEWSWWALETNYLSDEAIAYDEDSGGYNSLYSVGNVSTNLREDFYFANETDVFGPGGTSTPCGFLPKTPGGGTGTVWQHIVTGYSDIPNKLFEGFSAQPGSASRFNRQLVRVDKAAKGGYNLLFYHRQSGAFTSGQAEARCAADSNSCETVSAKYIILALPSGSIRLLDRETFFLQDASVLQILDTVLDNPSVRFFMAYESPWWTKAPNVAGPAPEGCQKPPTCGRSTTDLPIRQLYYWHTDPNGGPSFVLASYTNAEAERYWKSLEGGPAHDDLPGSVHQPGRNDGAQGHGPRNAPKTMARLAHEQFKKLVGLENDPSVPEPYYAHFQNWTKEPWLAGWHAWTAGNSDNELIPQILQPLPDEQLYICGESYSNVQGWVQGALNSTELMLQKKLGLSYPSWLGPGGTWLGPGSEGIPTV